MPQKFFSLLFLSLLLLEPVKVTVFAINLPINDVKPFVYDVNNSLSDSATNDLKSLLGENGMKIVKMYNEGLPIPESFILTTASFQSFFKNGRILNTEIRTQILDSILNIENVTNKKLYCGDNLDGDKFPLLLSLRFGEKKNPRCMPGAILNIGLNELSTKKLIEQGVKADTAYGMYLKFIKSYSEFVAKIDKSSFENISGNFEEKIKKYKRIYNEKTGDDFPENPKEQLIQCIEVMFNSCNKLKSKAIDSDANSEATSVIVQCMKFGDLYNKSGRGVMFSRNPETGENNLYGDFIMHMGSDEALKKSHLLLTVQELEKKFPDIYFNIQKLAGRLESIYGDMLCIKLIIENNTPYIISVSKGKCSIEAAIKTSIDLLESRKITEKQALLRIKPEQVESILYKCFKTESLKNAKKIAQGVPASPGVAAGIAVFSVNDAKICSSKGENAILIKKETTSEDISGIQSLEGILTASGGMTSHAAVVARGLGKCCVSGCEDIKFFKDSASIGHTIVNKGDLISINGTTGEVYIGKIETTPPSFSKELQKLLNIADSNCEVTVLANADTVNDACMALRMGAKGIGLCRTEHMFFESERINLMQQMILASSKSEREKFLEELLPLQQKDFKEIFTIMLDRPFSIRLLDPPLHEFLPNSKDEFSKLAKQLNISIENIHQTVEKLRESNPMMGHRGCRLLISHPEIVQMQIRAIVGAVIEATRENPNCKFIPEVMIPFVGDVEEIKLIKQLINDTICKYFPNFPVEYRFGVMIEIPRAALLADKIAPEVDFFSFGTNDLTQLVFGLSRDDSQKFLTSYFENNIFKADPFTCIDTVGVGALIKMAILIGKKANPNLKVGICGEHGGDPESIIFFSKFNVDYVSCSPFRIPVARFSAASSSLKTKK